MGKAANSLVITKIFSNFNQRVFQGKANWESEFHLEASIYQLKFCLLSLSNCTPPFPALSQMYIFFAKSNAPGSGTGDSLHRHSPSSIGKILCLIPGSENEQAGRDSHPVLFVTSNKVDCPERTQSGENHKLPSLKSWLLQQTRTLRLSSL